VSRLRAWAGQSLFNQLSLATLVLSLTVLLPATLLSFFLSWRLVERDLEARVQARAELEASRLGMALQAAQANLADAAASPVLGTALVDAQGWQQYGVPFLRSRRLPLPVEAQLALCDFRGRILASSARAPSLEPLDWVPAVMDRGEWVAMVHDASGAAHLLLIAPVRYAGSGTVEGAVVAEIPLDRLGQVLLTGDAASRLMDGAGRVLAGDGRAWPASRRAAELLQLPPPLAALQLRVEAVAPPSAAAGPLAWLAVTHLAVGLAVLALGLLLSRRLSARLSRPLRELASSARAIASSGSLDAPLPAGGRDEAGQLAQAFNDMVVRLRVASQAVEAHHEREQAEARGALRLAHGALERSNDAISISEPSGRIAYANQTALQLLGLPPEQVIGRTVSEVDPGFDEARWRELWAALRTRGRYASERTTSGPDGSPRWIELAVHLLRHGEVEYAVSVMRDVSTRRQAEAALRLAGVGTLAAGAAHEINNPLTSVMGNLAFLRDGLKELRLAVPAAQRGALAEATEAVVDALQGAERVRDVVRGLKDFSRPDQGQLAPTDVAEVMRQAVRLTRHEASLLGRLTETYLPTLPVKASARRLEQVFLNLLINALQALQGVEERGEVSVKVGPGGPGEVVAEVRDDGPGMTPEVRARIFEPFFTTKPVGAGTGLGLAICHGIVTSFGGRIDVTSEPGRGCTFRVVLPALEAADTFDGGDASRPTVLPAPGAWPPAGLPVGRRVLVIDDDPSVLRMLDRSLAGGPEVVAVSDPHEALRRLLTGERFDLVLCDLMMPGLSGMELHAALLAARPERIGAMVFITGGAFTERARDFLATCQAPCLEKPFDPEALRRLVAQRLAGAPALT
jgi:PAS domain S-box-containing protein